MRILVPIKQVPETNAVKMDEKTGAMVRDGVEAIINPLDLYAIEAAINLVETHGGEVIAISMGPKNAESALREAVAMGCSSGILVSDKAFAGSDTWSTAHILAQAVREIGNFDLIICGERATDGDTGQVGPGIAAFLDLPVITYVGKVEDFANGHCRVQRLIEDGHEILDVQLPAVITVVKEVAMPRLPTLRGKQLARKIDIPVLTTETLKIEPNEVGLKGSPTRVVKIFRPKVARDCVKFKAEDDTALDTAVDALITLLQKKNVLCDE